MPLPKAPPIGDYRNFTGVFEWRDVPVIGAPEVEPGYVLVGRCWCSIKARAGEMMLYGAQIDEAHGPRGTHTVRTWFREDLTTRHTLEIAGKRYRVLGILNDDARRYTELEVEEWGEAAIIGADTHTRSLWDQQQSPWDDDRSHWFDKPP